MHTVDYYELVFYSRNSEPRRPLFANLARISMAGSLSHFTWRSCNRLSAYYYSTTSRVLILLCIASIILLMHTHS